MGSIFKNLKLEGPQVMLSEFIADRGGEISWDWARCRDDVKAMVADMINKQVVAEREYTSHAGVAGRLHLRLTDTGHQVVAQYKLAKSKVAKS